MSDKKEWEQAMAAMREFGRIEGENSQLRARITKVATERDTWERRACEEATAAVGLRARIAELETMYQSSRVRADGWEAIAQQRAVVPESLIDRIKAAISRITNGQGAMRIPADDTDPDLVLADVLEYLAPAPKAQEQVEVDILQSVAETLRESGGTWEECTGCLEREDGHMVGRYPYSAAFKCYLGGGCSECGGIGALWRDPDYYEGLAEAMERTEQAPQPAVVGADRIETVREMFDSWMSDEWLYPQAVERLGDGYKLAATQSAWQAYRAGFGQARAQLTEGADALSEEHERETIQLIEERDQAEEWADKLANAIAQFTGLEIGEHSNINNPWAEALAALTAAGGRDEQSGLIEFARTLIEIALEGGNADGDDIQELAERLGLIRQEMRSEPCGELCQCSDLAEFPTPCFQLAGPLAAPQPAKEQQR